MKKLFGVILMFCLLGLTLSANKLESSSVYVYDDSDTLDIDTLVVVEEVVVDTVWDDDYILCDTIAEDNAIIGFTTEDIKSFSALGESSAELYAGKQFKIKNPDGSEFEYKVNEDGISVTLIKGNANGISKLVIPSSVEGLDSYFFVTEVARDAFETFFTSPLKGVKELAISEGIQYVGAYL